VVEKAYDFDILHDDYNWHQNCSFFVGFSLKSLRHVERCKKREIFDL